MGKAQLLEQALQLDVKERAELAQELISSLENLTPQEHERVWTEVAVRRALELKSGKVKGIPFEEVQRDVESRLR